MSTYQAAGICSWYPADHSAPNIEVLACTALSICTSRIALLCACIDIVSVKEYETHVLEITGLLINAKSQLHERKV